jgi:hypothetical protein
MKQLSEEERWRGVIACSAGMFISYITAGGGTGSPPGVARPTSEALERRPSLRSFPPPLTPKV